MIDGGARGWGDGGRAEPGESECGKKEKDRGNRDRQRRIGAHQLEAVIPRRSHIEIAHQISVSLMRRRRVAIFVSPVQPVPAERPRLAQGRTAVQETRDEPRSRSPLARSPWARYLMGSTAGPDRLSRGPGGGGTAGG